MTDVRGPGRPAQTVEEALDSLYERFEARLVEWRDHLIYDGNSQLAVGGSIRYLFGDKKTVNPIYVFERLLDCYNGEVKVKDIHRNCPIYWCFSPDHWIDMPLGSEPQNIRWTYEQWQDYQDYQNNPTRPRGR